jgi:hypothetical protein
MGQIMTDEAEQPAVLSDQFEAPEGVELLVDFTPIEEPENVLPSPE